MSELKFDEIGLRVGLEVHQQLATTKKLFCNCKPIEADEYTSKFSRKLRISKSELGEYDPAALFEKTKSKTMVYYQNQTSSCLVEQDEEPPHNLNYEAKEIALLISSCLSSKIFSEIYVMRKIVIDGSNTTGFQRTMLVSQGGNLKVNGRTIGVQTICLEEDAAKLLRDKENVREYSLDRLSIPLVEIALEPVAASPSEIRKIALTLGRLLRATKRVARGLGTIRQDVNVSIKDGGVVEVKGVQRLDQLEKVIEYEGQRQYGLKLICEKLKNQKMDKISKENDVFVVTEIFKNCKSKIIQKAIKDKAVIKAIRIKKFGGMFGYSPFEGIRLGKELGQLVRFFGIGGVFHSDELPNYGIENSEIENVKKELHVEQKDGFVIIAGREPKINFAIDSIIDRIEDAKYGVPAETRMATQSGETVYLRPRPGSSRMYPETDIPIIVVTKEEIEFARKNVPKSWDESLLHIQNKYQLNSQLAEQIFDSDYLDVFEEICDTTEVSPTFVVSGLTSTIKNLEREGLDSSKLNRENLLSYFELFTKYNLPKESFEIICKGIMSGKITTLDETTIKKYFSQIDQKEIEKLLDKIIQDNLEIIEKQGVHSIGALMGLAMKTIRGKASGKMINDILTQKIKKLLDNKKKK